MSIKANLQDVCGVVRWGWQRCDAMKDGRSVRGGNQNDVRETEEESTESEEAVNWAKQYRKGKYEKDRKGPRMWLLTGQ